jgi:hypothetical protein
MPDGLSQNLPMSPNLRELLALARLLGLFVKTGLPMVR